MNDTVEKEEEKEPEDLIELFTKSTDDMDIDECRAAYQKLRKLRTVRIASAKKTNELDLLLSKLTPDKAQKFLETINADKEKVEDTK